MANIPERIERELRPRLEAEAKSISEQFPLVKVSVSSFVGDSDSWHILGLECLFTKAAADEADEVALCVTTEGLDENPRISVDITWGDPSGYIEAEMFEGFVPFSEDVLAMIKTNLDRFFKTFHRIIKSGKPSNRSNRKPNA